MLTSVKSTILESIQNVQIPFAISSPNIHSEMIGKFSDPMRISKGNNSTRQNGNSREISNYKEKSEQIDNPNHANHQSLSLMDSSYSELSRLSELSSRQIGEIVVEYVDRQNQSLPRGRSVFDSSISGGV